MIVHLYYCVSDRCYQGCKYTLYTLATCYSGIPLAGTFTVEHCTSFQVLRLSFCTCLVRLLGAAFSTLRLSRYKEFIKQVGRTIRYVHDYVLHLFQMHAICSLVPSPTPSFSSLLSTVKRGGPGTFPHVSDVKGRKG